MVVRTFGVDLLALLMSLDRPAEADLSWLLYGPTDELVVEAEPEPDIDQPLRWAAE
jgi:hypothetical protein